MKLYAFRLKKETMIYAAANSIRLSGLTCAVREHVCRKCVLKSQHVKLAIRGFTYDFVINVKYEDFKIRNF